VQNIGRSRRLASVLRATVDLDRAPTGSNTATPALNGNEPPPGS
jgi:hypothetical protein